MMVDTTSSKTALSAGAIEYAKKTHPQLLVVTRNASKQNPGDPETEMVTWLASISL